MKRRSRRRSHRSHHAPQRHVERGRPSSELIGKGNSNSCLARSQAITHFRWLRSQLLSHANYTGPALASFMPSQVSKEMVGLGRLADLVRAVIALFALPPQFAFVRRRRIA